MGMRRVRRSETTGGVSVWTEGRREEVVLSGRPGQ